MFATFRIFHFLVMKTNKSEDCLENITKREHKISRIFLLRNTYMIRKKPKIPEEIYDKKKKNAMEMK